MYVVEDLCKCIFFLQVKIQPVAKYDWEHKYYYGNLIAVSNAYLAYAIRGKRAQTLNWRLINSLLLVLLCSCWLKSLWIELWLFPNQPFVVKGWDWGKNVFKKTKNLFWYSSFPKGFFLTATIITCSTEMMLKANGGFTSSALLRDCAQIQIILLCFCSLKLYESHWSIRLLPRTLGVFLLN